MPPSVRALRVCCSTVSMAQLARDVRVRGRPARAWGDNGIGGWTPDGILLLRPALYSAQRCAPLRENPAISPVRDMTVHIARSHAHADRDYSSSSLLEPSCARSACSSIICLSVFFSSLE